MLECVVCVACVNEKFTHQKNIMKEPNDGWFIDG
jgi:hypothetical protein